MYSGYYINVQTMGKLVRDSEIWSQKEPLHKHQRTQLNPLLRVAFSKTKIKFPSVYITNMKYFIVIVVFLPQQGERVQRERQPLWVGRPHFSSRFLDTNLLNWENTHTSLLLCISNKSHFSSTTNLPNWRRQCPKGVRLNMYASPKRTR